MCSGCLYIGPVTLYVDENVPPLILSHTDGSLGCSDLEYEGEEDPLCIEREQQLVFVTARDEDDDALEFYWEGTGSGPIENAVTSAAGNRQTSMVYLSPADVIDGERLRCTVSDGGPQEVIQSWYLVVYE